MTTPNSAAEIAAEIAQLKAQVVALQDALVALVYELECKGEEKALIYEMPYIPGWTETLKSARAAQDARKGEASQ